MISNRDSVPTLRIRSSRAVLMSVCASALLAVGLTGCGQDVRGSASVDSGENVNASPTTASTPSEEVPPIGATQEVVDSGATTRVTVESLSPATGSEYGLPASGELQQITVTLEGVDGMTNVNPLYFTARASDGTAYSAALASVDGQLPAGTVSAGDRIKGVVAFDVTGPPITSIRYNGPLGEELARWVGQSSAAPQPGIGSRQSGAVRGDLGLSTPITVPQCDGTGIVVLYSATAPGSYEQEVSAQLALNPGALYLRTDNACPSLRQVSDDGNAIYAVYRVAGRTEQEVCAAVAASGGNSYGKWLDNSTDPAYIIPC